MKKSLIIGAVLVGMLVAPMFALEITVDYLDGYLDIREDGEWYELAIGEEISERDTIRLDADSVAELSTPGAKLTLTKPGVYIVSDLLRASGESKSFGIASMVGGKIASLVREPDQSQTAVMGVRGAKSEDELEWMSGDAAELLESGKELLAEGEFLKAVEVLEEAYDFADAIEEDEILFYLGYANALMGEVRIALQSIQYIQPDSAMEFYVDLILLKGQLLAETFAYEEAIEWLGEYDPSIATDKTATQMSLLLQGISHRGMGDSSGARQVLQKAVNLDQTSDAGKAAQGMMAEL